MKCEKCNSESEITESYKFYYGNFVESRYIDPHHFLSKYDIEGLMNVILCENCVGNYIDKIRLVFSTPLALLGIAIIAMGLFASPANGDSVFIIVTGLFVLALAVFFYLGTYKEWRKTKNRQGFGDQLALRMKKKELKKAGFRKFFTRIKYDTLAK